MPIIMAFTLTSSAVEGKKNYHFLSKCAGRAF